MVSNSCIKQIFFSYPNSTKNCASCRKKCESNEIIKLFLNTPQSQSEDQEKLVKAEERSKNLEAENSNLKKQLFEAAKRSQVRETNLMHLLEMRDQKRLQIEAQNVKLLRENANMKEAFQNFVEETGLNRLLKPKDKFRESLI